MSAPVSLSGPSVVALPRALAEAIPELPRTLEDLGDDLSVWCEHLINPDGTENLEVAQAYADTGIALEEIYVGDKLAYRHGPTLQWALQNGYSEIAKIFIKKGVQWQGTGLYPERKIFPSLFSCTDQRLEPSKVPIERICGEEYRLPHLERGKHVSYVYPKVEYLPICIAAMNEDYETLILLIEAFNKQWVSTVGDLYKHLLCRSMFQFVLKNHCTEECLFTLFSHLSCPMICTSDMYYDLYRYARDVKSHRLAQLALEKYSLTSKDSRKAHPLCYSVYKEGLAEVQEVVEKLGYTASSSRHSQALDLPLEKEACFGSSLEIALRLNKMDIADFLLEGFDMGVAYEGALCIDSEPGLLFHILCDSPMDKTTAEERLNFVERKVTTEQIHSALEIMLAYGAEQPFYKNIHLLLGLYAKRGDFQFSSGDRYSVSGFMLLYGKKGHRMFSRCRGYRKSIKEGGIDALCCAVRDQDHVKMRKLLAGETRKSYEPLVSPLTFAVDNQDMFAIGVLLTSGIEVQDRDFSLAALKGNVVILEYLLAVKGPIKRWGDELLIKAMVSGSLECFNLLRERVGQPMWTWVKACSLEDRRFLRSLLEVNESIGFWLLTNCIAHGRDGAVEELVTSMGSQHIELLRRAIRERKCKTALALLSNGTEVDESVLKEALVCDLPEVATVIRKKLPEMVLLRV